MQSEDSARRVVGVGRLRGQNFSQMAYDDSAPQLRGILAAAVDVADQSLQVTGS